MVKNPLEKIAWLMIFMSACFNIKSFFADLSGFEFLGSCSVVFFVAFSQFYLARHVARQAGWSWARLSCWVLVAIMFLVSVLGASSFWMTTQNSDYMKLRAAEIAVKNAEAAKITALNLVNNCNQNALTKCVNPRTNDYKAAENEYNKASVTYNGMIAAQSKSETIKIISERFGIDLKQYFFYRAFILAALLETLVLVFSVLSDSKPLDMRSVEENESLKKTVKNIRSLSDLTDIQAQVLAAYEVYDGKDQILRNGLPSPMSQFTVTAFGAGKQGTTHKNNAINALFQLGFITEETYKKQMSSEV